MNISVPFLITALQDLIHKSASHFLQIALQAKLCREKRQGKTGGVWAVQSSRQDEVKETQHHLCYTQSGNADVHFTAVPFVLSDQCVIKYPRIFTKAYFCIYII